MCLGVNRHMTAREGKAPQEAGVADYLQLVVRRKRWHWFKIFPRALLQRAL